MIKDMATHGVSPKDAEALMERTRGLFSERADRVTLMPVYFHNALGESLVNLTKEPEAPERTLYTLCHQPWVNFTIDFHGRVVGCCRDLRSEYVLGNLLEQSADAIWNGEKMVNLRRALTEKRPHDIGICKACDVPWQGSYSRRTPWRRSGTSSSRVPGADSRGHSAEITSRATMKILFISWLQPSPRFSGSGLRTFHTMRALA